MAKRETRLDLSAPPDWPLMLDAAGAAAFVSLPLDGFLGAVALGDLPPPRRLAGRLLWSRREIEASLDPTGVAASSDHDPIAAAIAQAA